MGASITEGLALPALLVCGAFAAGCQPNLGAPPSLVSSPRLLAVSASLPDAGPAEAAPGSLVTYTALVADSDLATFPNGEPTAAPVDWAFCNSEKPLDDLDDVAEVCFMPPAVTVEIGQGLSVTGRLPSQGCDIFGPDLSSGAPNARPTDPDVTGGYYQPVRLILPTSGTPLLGAEESRILCGLVNGSLSHEFQQQYQPNNNPVLSGLGVVAATAAAPLTPILPDHGTSPGLSVKAGERVVLRASWPTCPGTPMQSCGAESYLYYNPANQMLTMQREALAVSWYATAGSYDGATTTVASDDEATTTDNGFTAPGAAGPVLLWLVLRDDRGGVMWNRYRLDVT